MFLPSFVKDKNGEFPVRRPDGSGRAEWVWKLQIPERVKIRSRRRADSPIGEQAFCYYPQKGSLSGLARQKVK